MLPPTPAQRYDTVSIKCPSRLTIPCYTAVVLGFRVPVGHAARRRGSDTDEGEDEPIVLLQWLYWCVAGALLVCWAVCSCLTPPDEGPAGPERLRCQST